MSSLVGTQVDSAAPVKFNKEEYDVWSVEAGWVFPNRL